jgi:hypothetical protein
LCGDYSEIQRGIENVVLLSGSSPDALPNKFRRFVSENQQHDVILFGVSLD